MSSHDDARFLRAVRLTYEMTSEEAAQLVCASRRSWEGWENGSRPIPQPKLELLVSKLEKLGARKEHSELVVVIANDHGWQRPVDVVSSNNFLGLKLLGDGLAVIKSLAVDPITKRPYVHKTQFDCIENKHVIDAASRWISVADAS